MVKEEEPQASTSQSSSDAKFNMMMKTMEKLMDKLFVDDKNQTKDQNEPQVRNPNFRRLKGLLFLKSCQGGKEIQMNSK